MTPGDVRRRCLALAGATVNVQWGEDHVFKVGGKMFACIGMRGGKFAGLSFKCSPDSFALLTQMPGVVPAPYLARAHWVALSDLASLPRADLEAYLARAYELVRTALPRKQQALLPATPAMCRTASAFRPERRSSSGRRGTSARSGMRQRRLRP